MYSNIAHVVSLCIIIIIIKVSVILHELGAQKKKLIIKGNILIDVSLHTSFTHLNICDVVSDQVTIVLGRYRHCTDKFINIFLLHSWGQNKMDHICES